jgi:putative flippase GtrA
MRPVARYNIGPQDLPLANMSSIRFISKQFAKYLAVGGLSNSCAYGLYVLITLANAKPLVSMSIAYLIASIATFTANKIWTFQSKTSLKISASRYIAAQACGYITNLTLLWYLYYLQGIPHEAAQLIGAGVVAIELFVLNRYYVFG